MDVQTLRKINQINQLFYEERASDFSKSRTSFWPGWEIFWNSYANYFANRPKILDVGCGNGRFGLFLKEKLANNLGYTGIDQSGQLLELAKKQFKNNINYSFSRQDIFNYKIKDFDLIVAFGLMHHVPGEAQRRRLVYKLAEGLKENGLLVISFWRVDELTNLTKRRATPKQMQVLGINPNKLEPGDFFLPFGRKALSWRYVHSFSLAEIRAYKLLQKTQCLGEYRVDGRNGRLNTYLVLRKLPPEQRESV